MQPNDLTIGGTAYEKWETDVDRSVYAANDHTSFAPHTLALYRNRPAKGSSVSRVRVKLTRSITVGESTVPVIVEFAAALPVGTPTTVASECAEQVALFLASPEFNSLLIKQEI